MPLNARMFPGIYGSLGIDLDNLGCVMLDVAPIHVNSRIERYAYKSEEDFWVDGIVAHNPHITLMYGLLIEPEMMSHAERLLQDWEPGDLIISGIEDFSGPDSEYACLVGTIEITDQLKDANYRLAMLPHVNTFANEYKPHVTLAYVTKQSTGLARVLLNDLVGTRLTHTGLTYSMPESRVK